MNDSFQDEPIRPWDEWAWQLATSADPMYPSVAECASIQGVSAESDGGGPMSMAERFDAVTSGALRDPIDRYLPRRLATPEQEERMTDWRRQLIARKLLFGDLVDEAEPADCVAAVCDIWDRYTNERKIEAAEESRECIRVCLLSAATALDPESLADAITFLKGLRR